MATPKSQITSFALSINCCYCLREGLEKQPESTTSNSFINGPNFSRDFASTTVKAPKTGFAMWRGHCLQSRIKDLTPTASSLTKFPEKVIVCMILTSKGRLGPDIWPETEDQVKGTEDIMRKIWAKKAHHW